MILDQVSKEFDRKCVNGCADYVSLDSRRCIALRMDNWRFNVLFDSISVISGRWLGDNERLCAKEPRLWSGRLLPQAGSNPEPLDQ